MSGDTIDRVRADLAALGRADEVQWASGARSWDEGTVLCETTDGGIRLRHVGRGEDDDRLEVFESEAAAAAALRSRLLAPSTGRRMSAEERREVNERMQARARATLRDLSEGPADA